jgi:hypothetical protein
MKSRLGFILAGVYFAAALYLIAAQGLTGESFIAVILGIPWSFILAFFEYGNVDGVPLIILLLFPIILNGVLLYKIGSHFKK